MGLILHEVKKEKAEERNANQAMRINQGKGFETKELCNENCGTYAYKTRL